jgi:putative Ca2+/H+ antiporter (TMEM165/GDT1 family)
VNLGILASTFGLIFLAELGDKTQLTAMALATRYPWRRVFLGAAAAFLVLNALAVGAGRVLFELVPPFWIRLVSAALFLYFGVATLRAREEDEEREGGAARPRRGPAFTAFTMIGLAELGDKTQLATATLAAQHASPLEVFAGATLALWTVSLLGVLVGTQLLRFLPLRTVHRIAGVLFLAFGAVLAYQAFADR